MFKYEGKIFPCEIYKGLRGVKFCFTLSKLGYSVAQLVEALRYKPEDRGFDSRYHWNFSLT